MTTDNTNLPDPAQSDAAQPSQAAAIARLQAESQTRQAARAWWRRALRLGRVIALVAVVAALLAALVWKLAVSQPPPANCNTSPCPEPGLFSRNDGATLGKTTPQQAFAVGVTLTPCDGAPNAATDANGPARSTTITWLVAGPNYGFARIQPVCDPPARQFHLWLMTYVRDGSFWNIGGGGIIEEGGWQARGDIAQSTPPVPAWLPLPNDTYAYLLVTGPQGNHPPASVVAWDAQTRLFVFGHVADQAIRPGGATSVLVDGRAGWLVTENGLTTVTAILPDTTTLFFSGTAAPAEVQALAADAFAHADQALESLVYPTITPPGATPYGFPGVGG